ncbi:MAG TPA: peptidylprolyl isomerase [Bacteroidales bacterium]|nr:peptidylprolyl isomerase [Bacteroidales bacterium]
MNFGTEAEKFGYALGMSVGTSLAQQQITNIVSDAFITGFEHANLGKETQLSLNEANALINAYVQNLRAEKGNQNLKEGIHFLNENKAKPGIVEMPSGLQYRVVKPGTGNMPKATDTVSVHYRGTLINGTEFDSSYSRNQPAQFPVNGVIKGWTEALQLMNSGSIWELFIPAHLAYGTNAPGGIIEANMTLLFTVELLEII